MGENPLKQTITKPVYSRKLTIISILFLAPAFFVMLITTIIPVFFNLYLSFNKWNVNSPAKFVGFQNYIKMFSDRSAKAAIYNSLYIGILSIIICIALGLVLALLIYRLRNKEGAFFRFIFFSPSMMPMTVIGLLFVFVLAEKEGLLNNILNVIGLSSFTRGWLGGQDTVLASIASVAGWKFSGTAMMLFYTSMLGIPNSFFETAKIEGANYLQNIWYIILPLIKPTIKLVLSLSFIWAFATYDIVLAMTKGGPGDLSTTIPLKMITVGFTFNKFGYAATLGVTLTILVSSLILISRKFLKGESYEY
jgi:raffinose/stachyose/melibiose transport system permease protein